MLTFRVGIGHDTHRLQNGSAILLGGIRIPCDFSLVGHSDADVLLHAVTDALLGAACLGDIGEIFPDDDSVNLGRDSAEMLAEALLLVKKAGWKVVNLDCIVFAEMPKLGHHKLDIRLRIAELLEINSVCVNVKAKTGEKIGTIGRSEAIAAQCVILLNQPHETKPKLLEMAQSETLPVDVG
ncbi:MAG: 2-C-methyl-D-erythritol 2,4-cyclodiphosphate synthase [Planctomycetaceae bacterium]|nr:2-C-methyl-D-erythritol 2,4-cyclodiphosphate synthase [Planctomycetaceae bacterium]